MIWHVRQWLFFCALILTSFASASVNLDCNGSKLQGLCPSDNEPRMCTCVVTSGDILRWSTTQPGVFPAPGVSFSSADPVGHSSAAMGFTAELTNNTEGQLTSILIFTPSVMSTTGLTITCENPNTGEGRGKTLTVTYSDSPKIRQIISFNVTCDTSDGNRASITFSNDETGGSDIQYYNGTVTGPSGFSSRFNVTTNTVVITGLQCSTSYSVDVTAANCAGVSNVKTTSFVTPQPDLSTFTITSACFDSSSKIRIEWMPPNITSCYSITGYTVTVVNNISQQVSFGTEGTALSVIVSNVSAYYNITIYANTNCGTITTSNSSFILWSDNKCVTSTSSLTSSTTLCVTPNQTHQNNLWYISLVAVSIPVTLLLALIAMILLLILLIITKTHLCRKKSHALPSSAEESVHSGERVCYSAIPDTDEDVEADESIKANTCS